MSIAEIKMCIAEIDAKLQEKAECGGVMPPYASYGQASTRQEVGNE